MYHDSRFFSFASFSYFWIVRSSTLPVRNRICPPIVDFPASTWPMNTMLRCSFWPLLISSSSALSSAAILASLALAASSSFARLAACFSSRSLASASLAAAGPGAFSFSLLAAGFTLAFASTSLASASAGFSSALGGAAAAVGSLRGREGFASAPDGPGSAPASGRRVLFFFGTESFLCFASCSSRLSVFSSGGGAWS